MRLTETADVWWKNAIIYCLDIETFFDTDGDGRGDIRGLSQRIDHLAELGVTCLWLMPFYPTPDRDDGYDITDFYGVDSRLGTHGDLVELITLAQDRGIRVIADLVVNHTSDQHPWFQSARSSRQSPYRDWYVWRDEPPADADQGIVFPDQETSLWQYDEQAGQYYLHQFYKHQPDLDIANPEVREEIMRIIGFWLQLGLSGFRVDAVPFLLETKGAVDAANLPDPHDYLRDLRAFMNRRDGQAVLLGEVNLPYKDTRQFFGDEDGDELTMCFDFIGMQKLYLSLARSEPGELIKALRERPDPPEEAHWGTFVRNHDELTLDKLTDEERQEVFTAFGPDEDMQLYGRGLRRRLPPMLGNDLNRIKLVYSLLFSLPGTPVLFYGEEIGMGENLAAEGRNAVRTPMQWTKDANGGFSTADPDKLAGPVVEGDLSPEHVNVADQRRDPDSLLNWIKLLAQTYRECPELSWGKYTILEHESPSVFAQRSDYEGGTVIALHNFSDQRAEVTLAVSGTGVGVQVADLLTGKTTPIDNDGTLRHPVAPYGCCWLRVVHPGDRYIV
ncbi:maltose alpha-D-glucosyltransferase/alpha-amylase [Kribbella orskensis]|uniref:Maltose alpha-D-glucosyltransferase/alpha-amylase n=1 Tax=Kribbella orskensis TaxID=2512216 RepID=A0ABY2BMN2_9ACTN|nr:MULTISPECIES: alpha-amylase family protein [Kribbella]TCN41130.1 maltose alpha-D-glucosyltransferase/alpha-amylase [Kribbella sp. VKM Ac-2500]TCO24382.1 maltose alpha-D-glucosyltransferase/alpha-amylase [Kribbella orskensis]